MPLSAALAVGVAACCEGLVGEPPARWHPVAWLGRVVAPLDRSWRAPRLVGLGLALGVPLAAAAVSGGVVVAAARLHPLAGVVAAGVALFACSSLRMLLAEARAVVAVTDSDLDAARTRLRSLAGRDAATLDAARVRSAAVESLAENLADGLLAPLVAFSLAALAAGPSGVATGGGAAISNAVPPRAPRRWPPAPPPRRG